MAADSTLQGVMNDANPNKIADALGKIKVGTMLVTTTETIVVTAHVGTLAKRAAVIQSVRLAAGAVTGAGHLQDVAAVNTREVFVGTDQQTLTFLAADAVTSAAVVYQQLAVDPTDALSGF